MSKIRFYTDEHIARAVIRGLRERGIDVLSVPDAGMLGASDGEHLAFAQTEGRVFFTHDDDFLRLAATGLSHAGIIYAPRRVTVGETIRGLLLIYQHLDAESMVDTVQFLPR